MSENPSVLPRSRLGGRGVSVCHRALIVLRRALGIDDNLTKHQLL